MKDTAYTFSTRRDPSPDWELFNSVPFKLGDDISPTGLKERLADLSKTYVEANVALWGGVHFRISFDDTSFSGVWREGEFVLDDA